MLRVKPPWSASVRLLDERDRGAVLAICDRDPVTNVFVSSRVRSLGLEPGRLGAQMWGHAPGGRLESLCYSGANLVPVAATPDAVVAFADRALRQGRRCSSVVGPASAVQALWGLLRPHWGPAREIRPVQRNRRACHSQWVEYLTLQHGAHIAAADALDNSTQQHVANVGICKAGARFKQQGVCASARQKFLFGPWRNS